MKPALRRAAFLVLLAVVSGPAAAQMEAVPRVSLPAVLGAGLSAAPSALGGAAMRPGLTGTLSAPALGASLLAPSLSAVTAAPVFAAQAPIAAPAAAAGAAFVPVSAAVSAPSDAAPAAAPAAAASDFRTALSAALSTPALDELRQTAAARDRGGRFDGGRAAPPAEGRNVRGRGDDVFIKNDEGVWVGGRVADQYREIRRLYALLSPKMDLSDTMNVMDDAYDESRVKLAAVEMAAAERNIAASSVHLEDTRTWIDAVLTDEEGRQIAVHTHRVYFHPADNADSEIREGIRRVDAYIEEAKKEFASGGHAEQDMDARFDQVQLTFDVRGYQQIADHIRAKEAELQAEQPGRFKFSYIVERPLPVPKMRAEYNRLVEKYKDQPQGVMNIIDGVTYSRYVGLLHELKSHEDSVNKGETVLQAGRDFFEEIPQPDGSKKRRYITEFDAVVRTKDGTIILREDKSVRTPLPLDVAMESTFLYKLEIYKANRALIEKSLGAPLNVRFSVDVGGASRRPARQGVLVWKDVRQQELLEYLKTQGPILTEKYGFPVSFVFVNSHANEPPDLFYRKAVSQEDWEASQRGGGRRQNRRRNSRN